MSISVSRQTTNHVPEPVAPIAELMSEFRAPWALCGGWAVDAWLGRQTRDHGDVDIAIFQDDRLAFFEHMAGWQLVAHDPNVAGNTLEPWNGRSLDLPAHIHGRSPHRDRLPDGLDDPLADFELDIQVNERSGSDCIISREPRICLPLRRCVQLSGWGLPTLTPDVILFYKASGRHVRRRDELDFIALLPHLTDEQRDWLRQAISLVGHPWLSQLSP